MTNTTTGGTDEYAVQMPDDSMHPRVHKGEYVVAEPGTPCRVGDEVVAYLRDGRRVVRELAGVSNGRVRLVSVNSKHDAIDVPDAEINSIHFVGIRTRRAPLGRQIMPTTAPVTG